MANLNVTNWSVAPPGSRPATVERKTDETPGVTPTIVAWGQIGGNILNQIDLQQQFALKAGLAELNAHIADLNNPHQVTQAQVGLPLVDNTPDSLKPLSGPQLTAVQALLTGPVPTLTIVASQISDSNASGRSIITGATAAGVAIANAANAAAQRTALGASASGNTVFTGTAAQGRTALGSSASGDTVFTGTPAQGRTALGSSASGDTVFTGTAAQGRTALGSGATGDALFLTASAAAARIVVESALVPDGCAQLVLSGGNLTLLPYNGNLVWVNGTFLTIPAAGVTLSAAGAAANTNYYIYLAAGPVLERSTTAPAVDTTTGVKIKTGDATRRLVGFARTTAGAVWADSNSQRFVLSHFNRRSRSLQRPLLANAGVFSTGVFAPVAGQVTAIEWINWVDEAYHVDFCGYFTQNVANVNNNFCLFTNGVAADNFTSVVAALTGNNYAVNLQLNDTPTVDGYYLCELYISQITTVSTTTIGGSGSPGFRCVTSGLIRG